MTQFECKLQIYNVECWTIILQYRISFWTMGEIWMGGDVFLVRTGVTVGEELVVGGLGSSTRKS